MGRMPDGMVNSRKENKIMLEKVKEIVAESLNVEESTLSETTSFKEDLGADSLDLFEMVMALEEEFEVEIPTEDLENIKTIGDVEAIFRVASNLEILYSGFDSIHK